MVEIQKGVTVLGSINEDIFLILSNQIKVGETVNSKDFKRGQLGGKVLSFI